MKVRVLLRSVSGGFPAVPPSSRAGLGVPRFGWEGAVGLGGIAVSGTASPPGAGSRWGGGAGLLGQVTGYDKAKVT